MSVMTIELTAGSLRLKLSPEIGGAISGFEWCEGEQRRPILRTCPDPLEQVLDAACFPLVPFVNRIRDGRFTFRGREVRLRPNMAGDPSPLHGQGWLNPWTVEETGKSSATLAFHHQPGEWPWAYEAKQIFKLDESGLSVDIGCRNVSDEPMPCGLGLHPYFPCSGGTTLDTGVEVAWTIDDEILPVDRVPATGRYDLRGRRICGQDLDNGFGGWDGRATIADPSYPFTVQLSSSDARFFQVYSPATGGIFVAEPVTHANAALNEPEARWPELGMRVLAPGESMTLSMRLAVVPQSAASG
jgi:aldose 1-epimerase